MAVAVNSHTNASFQSFNSFCVGSSRSKLAIIQTKDVLAQLSKVEPESNFKMQPIDKNYQQDLLDGKFDFVVHSLKDLRVQLSTGLIISCVMSNELPFDAFVAKRGTTASCLADLPENAIIGTSSARRTAQLKRIFPHLKFVDCSGNLNMRLRMLDESQVYSGLVLAAAGLTRLGWGDRLTQVLDESWCAYAAGQGVLAIVCRANNTRVMKLVNKIMEQDTFIRCVAERTLLRGLEASLSAPVAVQFKLVKDQEEAENARLQLRARVLSKDGAICIEAVNEVSIAMQQPDDKTLQQMTLLEEPSSLNQQPEDALESIEDQPAYDVSLVQFEPSQLQLSQQRLATDLGMRLVNDLLDQGARSMLQTGNFLDAS